MYQPRCTCGDSTAYVVMETMLFDIIITYNNL